VTSRGGSRAAGEIFDDQYELLDDLGSGKFGEVWKALDLRLSRIVALKLLKDSDEDAAWQEGQRLTELKSPHILPIYNAGLAIDVPYLVTEYAAKGTLADLISPAGISPRRAVEITRAVLRGLELAHQRRVLHRDVKPGNIFLRANGDAQLGDFGLAAIMAADGSAKGHGDLDIRAPEVLKGGRLTATSDVYSAGVTMWAMLVGGLPFQFDPTTGFASHKAAVAAGVPDIRDASPCVPLTLAKVVRKACAVKPKERYATVADFDNALSRLKVLSADAVPVPAHSGHRNCWEIHRRSDGHIHTVCVEVSAAGDIEIVTRHRASCLRVSDLCRTVRTETAVRIALRRAFDSLT
jgi:eukaryotic-like serine/threonine-protein kinase